MRKVINVFNYVRMFALLHGQSRYRHRTNSSLQRFICIMLKCIYIGVFTQNVKKKKVDLQTLGRRFKSLPLLNRLDQTNQIRESMILDSRASKVSLNLDLLPQNESDIVDV